MPVNTPEPGSAGLHHAIADRWSPREFSGQPVDSSQLRSLFEAARWSPSCFNEQPWRFIIATQARPEQFAQLLSLLAEKNQAWAKDAWVIGFTAARKTFTMNGLPNRFGLYDTGAAGVSLAVEATARNLYVHFMGGFDADRARAEFAVPEEFEIGAAFVVGHLKDGAAAPVARSRKPLSQLVFAGNWETPAEF